MVSKNDRTELMVVLGGNLRDRRRERGLRQQDIGASSLLTRQAVLAIEKGRISPFAGSFLRMANLTSPLELVRWERYRLLSDALSAPLDQFSEEIVAEQLGEVLKTERSRSKLRQSDLARGIKMTRVSIIGIEHGKQKCSIVAFLQILYRCNPEHPLLQLWPFVGAVKLLDDLAAS